MLASVIRKCWPALHRDLLALGYRASDMFTERLTFAELVSIVVGANPHTSVRWFLDEGWTRESHLLAGLSEQQAGLARLPAAYQRPGGAMQPSVNNDKAIQADAYTWDEFDELERIKYSKAGQEQAKAGRSGKRVF